MFKHSTKRTRVATATPRINKRQRRAYTPTHTGTMLSRPSRDSALSSYNGLSQHHPRTTLRRRSRPATVPRSTNRAPAQSRIPLSLRQIQELASSSHKPPASNHARVQTTVTRNPESPQQTVQTASNSTPPSPPISLEGSLPTLFESSSTSNTFQVESIVSDVELNGSSTTILSDAEEIYLPFLERLSAGASTSEISILSVKEFIAGVLLGYHTKSADISYMTMPYIDVSKTHRELCFFDRTVKGFQAKYHEGEPDRKKDQKTCPYGCMIDGCHRHLGGTTYVSSYASYILTNVSAVGTTTSALFPQNALNIRISSVVVPERTLTK
jgi:hypothetical protein